MQLNTQELIHGVMGLARPWIFSCQSVPVQKLLKLIIFLLSPFDFRCWIRLLKFSEASLVLIQLLGRRESLSERAGSRAGTVRTSNSPDGGKRVFTARSRGWTTIQT